MTDKCIAGKDIKTDTFQNISMISTISAITKNMDCKLRVFLQSPKSKLLNY